MPKIVNPFRCKHCKVPVVSRFDTSAILGKEHKKSCPRSKGKSASPRLLK